MRCVFAGGGVLSKASVILFRKLKPFKSKDLLPLRNMHLKTVYLFAFIR